MRNDIFSKSVKNRGFSQNSKGGTKANFSKMADFLGKLWKLRKIGKTAVFDTFGKNVISHL